MNLQWTRNHGGWILADQTPGAMEPNKVIWWNGSTSASIWLEGDIEPTWREFEIPKGYTEDEIKALLAAEYRMGQ